MPRNSYTGRNGCCHKDAAVTAQDEVLNWMDHVGTSADWFNGLMRHYDLRKGENVADIQVNLTDKGDRSAQSHDITKKCGSRFRSAKRWGANAKSGWRTGPQSLNHRGRDLLVPIIRNKFVARQIKAIFDQTEGMVDTDVFIEDDQTNSFWCG